MHFMYFFVSPQKQPIIDDDDCVFYYIIITLWLIQLLLYNCSTQWLKCQVPTLLEGFFLFLFFVWLFPWPSEQASTCDFHHIVGLHGLNCGYKHTHTNEPCHETRKKLRDIDYKRTLLSSFLTFIFTFNFNKKDKLK